MGSARGLPSATEATEPGLDQTDAATRTPWRARWPTVRTSSPICGFRRGSRLARVSRDRAGGTTALSGGGSVVPDARPAAPLAVGYSNVGTLRALVRKPRGSTSPGPARGSLARRSGTRW